MKATARKGYDETIVFPRGFTVAVVEHLGDLVMRVELHDSARVERMPLTPHEARQIASLLRNGTELDHIPHRSCDEALEAARKERDAAVDEIARMRREMEALRDTDELVDFVSAGWVAERIDAILGDTEAAREAAEAWEREAVRKLCIGGDDA